jgi:hypothetical protein
MAQRWQSRPDAAIRAALLLSAVIHLAVFVFCKLPPMPSIEEGYATLTVVILPPWQGGKKMEEAPQVFPEKPVETLPSPEPMTPEVSKSTTLAMPKQTPLSSKAVHPSNPVTTESMANDEKDVPLPVVPVVENRQNQSLVRAQALLLVGEDGRVQTIVWNRLPAVTEEELKRMLSELRAKVFLATGRTYTTTEDVEVPR